MVQPHLWACGRRKWQTSLCHSVPIPISSISMSPDATASSQKSQPEALKSWRDLSVGNTQQTALCPWSSGTFCLVTLHHHQKYECHFKNLQNMIHFPFFKPPMVETCWTYWQKKPRHQASSWLEEKLLRCFAHCFRGIFTVEEGGQFLP